MNRDKDRARDNRSPEGDETADRRMDTRVSVDLWMRQEHGPELCERHVANLSAGGMQLDHGLPHPLGTRVRLRFSLPGDTHAFDLQAEIVAANWRDRRPITHLRFVELSGEDHIRLTRFTEGRDG